MLIWNHCIPSIIIFQVRTNYERFQTILVQVLIRFLLARSLGKSFRLLWRVYLSALFLHNRQQICHICRWYIFVPRRNTQQLFSNSVDLDFFFDRRAYLTRWNNRVSKINIRSYIFRIANSPYLGVTFIYKITCHTFRRW